MRTWNMGTPLASSLRISHGYLLTTSRPRKLAAKMASQQSCCVTPLASQTSFHFISPFVWSGLFAPYMIPVWHLLNVDCRIRPSVVFVATDRPKPDVYIRVI